MSTGVDIPIECKRTHSIYISEEFSNIIKKCFNWGQSEKLPDNSYYPLYIGEDLIDQMRSPDNQIIWGRRGTGKTHLLRAFTQRINDDKDINEIAYYISCNDIKYEMPVNLQFADDVQRMKDYARETYKNFLINLIEQIIDTYDHYIKEKRCKNINRINFKAIEDDIAILMDICTTGIPRNINIIGNNISSSSDSKSNKSEININIRPQIKKPITSLLKFLTFKFKHGNEKETVNSYHVESKVIFDISFIEIRKAMKALLSSLDIDTLYLCIDELCLIDDKSMISFQPIFLDYLRQTFFGLNKICVKIASIREITKLNSQSSIESCYGIQSGHDIFELADLDFMYINDDKFIKKFEDIVTMRIIFFSKLYNSETFVYETDYIIKTIFKSKRNFKILISLSHGIPRNFLHILQVCLVSINYDIAHYFIHPYLISEVVMAFYVNDRRSNIPMNKNSVYRMISSYVEKKNEYFFMISVEHVKRMHVEIGNLIYIEILHEIPSALIPDPIMDSYKAFFVDSGKYLHTLKEYNKTEYKNRLESFILAIPKDIKDNYSNYVIELDNIQVDIIECPNCSATINKEHPIYQKFNCCYTCGFQLSKENRTA